MNSLIEAEKVLEIAKAQTEAIEKVLKGLDETRTELSSTVKAVKNVENRMDTLEETQEITTIQVKKLNSLVRARVCSLLKVPRYKKDRTREQQKKYKKYAPAVFSCIYTGLKDHGHMGSPYSATLKKDFDTVCDEIEGFYPANGIDDLMDCVDEYYDL